MPSSVPTRRSPGVPKPIHLYHDSYEYFTSGWTPALFDAFRAKRGYDLRDHLAELAGVGDREAVCRVKCDYRETLSDLIIEDVFPRWTAWCRARGIRTRNEAHGAPANLLDFYALADVPETEMFGKGDRNILISKFASSAAHVTGKKLVSSESCTWIDEHFNETLAETKVFLDRLFLAGVNHVFFHGFCYSPVDAVWPGWCFYASLEMNPRNPFWRDVPTLAAYITRCQSIFQTWTPDEDVLGRVRAAIDGPSSCLVRGAAHRPALPGAVRQGVCVRLHFRPHAPARGGGRARPSVALPRARGAAVPTHAGGDGARDRRAGGERPPRGAGRGSRKPSRWRLLLREGRACRGPGRRRRGADAV